MRVRKGKTRRPGRSESWVPSFETAWPARPQRPFPYYKTIRLERRNLTGRPCLPKVKSQIFRDVMVWTAWFVPGGVHDASGADPALSRQTQLHEVMTMKIGWIGTGIMGASMAG